MLRETRVWSTDTVRNLYSFWMSFVLCWLELNNNWCNFAETFEVVPWLRTKSAVSFGILVRVQEGTLWRQNKTGILVCIGQTFIPALPSRKDYICLAWAIRRDSLSPFRDGKVTAKKLTLTQRRLHSQDFVLLHCCTWKKKQQQQQLLVISAALISLLTLK